MGWDWVGHMSEVAYHFIFPINSIYINRMSFMFLMIHCIASLLHFGCSVEYIKYLSKHRITEMLLTCNQFYPF